MGGAKAGEESGRNLSRILILDLGEQKPLNNSGVYSVIYYLRSYRFPMGCVMSPHCGPSLWEIRKIWDLSVICFLGDIIQSRHVRVIHCAVGSAVLA